MVFITICMPLPTPLVFSRTCAASTHLNLPPLLLSSQFIFCILIHSSPFVNTFNYIFFTPKQSLTIHKLIAGTSEPLAGVTFRVTDSDGTALGPDNGRFVTDRDGCIVIENLTPGTTVTARETETVSGYVLDATPQTIRIREGESQSLTFYNAPNDEVQ